MGQVGERVSSNSRTDTVSTYKRGSHNEQNYEGLAKGQGIDWDTTSGGAGAFEGLWKESPWGHPITYGGVVSAAKQAGDDAGKSAADVGDSMAGNAGQAKIIQLMGSDVFENAWHYQANGYGTAAEYITEHCPYPSALGSIIDDLDSLIEEFQSTDY